MNNTNQVSLERTPFDIQQQKKSQTIYFVSKRPQKNYARHSRAFAEKKYKTEAVQQRYDLDRQTMEVTAKKGLFEESQVNHQRQIMQSYPKIKGQNLNRKSSSQIHEEITAFTDDHHELNQHHIFNLTFKKCTPKVNPTQQKVAASSEQIHQEVYWNKKRHLQVAAIRPAALINPVKIELTKDQFFLLNSPKTLTTKKDFQSIIRQFARKTKQVYNNQDMNRSKSNKQSENKAISLSKKLVRLRSKSTNIIEQQYKKTEIYNEIQKMAEKCEFDLQIKCLNSQKQEIFNKRQEMKRENEVLKEKIKSLIVKQNKMNDINHTQPLLPERQGITEDLKIEVKAQINLNEKDNKLKFLNDRSKSCFVSTFKGPQSKKLKIVNILSKIAKFRNEQLENRRKEILLKQSQAGSYTFQMIRYSTKHREDSEKQRSHHHLLKINQQYSEFDAKNRLIKSIKSYCEDKNITRLPFMSNKANKSLSLHPENTNY